MQNQNPLWLLGLSTIRELETDRGILASGKEEIYGCIFGRDSLITALKLLRVFDKTKDQYFLLLVKKILLHLAELQGTEINIESGEEPGKCIHEFRPDNHAHLTKQLEKPWYVYPDNIMRNYDSIDSTPLFLIAIHRYLKASEDQQFLATMQSHVEAALQWILIYADTNTDGFIDYQLNPNRKFGGLITQSWMDSAESVFHESGEAVVFPIAPVEVQAYTYHALKIWAEHFASDHPLYGRLLIEKAEHLKEQFNEKFVIEIHGQLSLAAGIDGEGKPLTSVRSSIGHCLWASTVKTENFPADCIINESYIPSIVSRLLSADMFEPEAGIRTLSTNSRCFSANSYHNGSIWPHDNGVIAEGLEKLGFVKEATLVQKALLKALTHFNTPIELFVYENGKFDEYCSPQGQLACKKQAWSAAALLTSTM